MKKVLIISYFYPPSNFVGGERTAAWFRHLPKEGVYPIVVTRCWNEGQTDIIGTVEHNSYSLEKQESGEIHRVPIPNDLRNKLKGPLRKVLTLWRLLKRKPEQPQDEFNAVYQKCRELLINDPEIKIVMASGRPFESFQLGYLLKKEFDIAWIPDYRDEWNTHQAPAHESWIWKKIRRQETRFEKQWTSNADHFISVSPSWVKRIENFTGIKGSTIMNGYEELYMPELSANSDDNALHLLYAGSLYSSQRIEIIINAARSLQKEGAAIKMTFIGTEIMPDQKNRLLHLTEGMENITFLERMNKKALADQQAIADILIMTAFENVDGWLPVKMFDYYASGKPILVCPSDNDVIERFIVSTNSGICLNDLSELKEQLSDWCQMKEQHQPIHFERNIKEGKKYSREYQTKLLGEILNNISG